MPRFFDRQSPKSFLKSSLISCSITVLSLSDGRDWIEFLLLCIIIIIISMVEQTDFEHQLCLHLTGFGEFGGRKDNPTTDLVNSIEETLAAKPVAGLHLASKRVIYVAIEDCDAAIKDIYECIAKQREENPKFAKRYMVLNLGVHGGAKQIALEIQGVNNKDFRIPDMRGNTPVSEPINHGETVDHCLKTSLPLASICSNLIAKGANVACSTNAGKYICNYTYYRNLMHLD